MKRLDRYIFFQFLQNFGASFVILMAIFIFQMIWLFIDNLAGKGLDPLVIGKFIFYMIPDLTEKVLPLTVLLSSILTFGSFAEHYEFAAMKASGISLQRSMRSLIVLVSFMGLFTFYFANEVIPAAKKKSYSLQKNIAKVKPAVAIAEGLFNDFEGTGMNIHVVDKYGEDDRMLQGVTIHKKDNTGRNNVLIKATTGEFINDPLSNHIQLLLHDGVYYENIQTKGIEQNKKHPWAQAKFDTYRLLIDLSEVYNVDLDESIDVNSEKMKNIFRLQNDIDSIYQNNQLMVEALTNNIRGRLGAPLTYLNPQAQAAEELASDIDTSSVEPVVNMQDLLSRLDEYKQVHLYGVAQNNITNALTTIQNKKEEMYFRYKVYQAHILELHKKYALALSCIVLFFVGAPLGAIIRKGGLGLPLIIAVVLFLTYYFLGVFTYNYAKEGNIHPYLGAWLPTMIMLPLGVFLTYRATHDQGLLSMGPIIGTIEQWWNKWIKQKTT